MQTVETTNGTGHGNPLEVAEQQVRDAEARVAKAQRADRKAGEKLAEKADEYKQARDVKTGTKAELDAARAALAKAEAKLSDEQGKV